MEHLARLSIRRPRAALLVWAIVAAALTLIGLGVSHSLSPSVTTVPGTASARAERIAGAHFGPTQLVPILLQGPRAQIDRQGPRLVIALQKRPATRVLSAWSGGTAGAQLRPRPDAAMLVVSVDRPIAAVLKTQQPAIDRLVARTVHGPVRAYISGQPSIDRALEQAALDRLRVRLAIASALIFVLMLFVTRALLAALAVALTAGVGTFAALGAIAIVGHLVTLDPVGITLGAVTGMLTGSGFALVVLAGFRRELEAGTQDIEAALLADLKGPGRAVLLSGTVLALALAAAAVLGPTELMVSLGAGMLAAGLIGTGGAVVVLPAALSLLGRRMFAPRLWLPGILDRLWNGLVGLGGRVARWPLVAGVLGVAALLALAVPALSLHSGPPSVRQLPAGAPARIAFERISHVMGPGFATPYNVIVVSPHGPITTPAHLAAIHRFETRIAADPAVASVTGPGTLLGTARQLQTFGPSLNHSATVSERSKRDLVTLIRALAAAGTGSDQLTGGAIALRRGAGQLEAGLSQAQNQSSAGFLAVLDGVGRLTAGARQAEAASQTLTNSIRASAQGAAALTKTAAQLTQANAATSSALGKATTSNQSAVQAVQNATNLARSSGNGELLRELELAAGAQSTTATQLGLATSSQKQASTAATSLAYGVSGVAAQYEILATSTEQLTHGLGLIRTGDQQLSQGVAAGATTLRGGFLQLLAGARKISDALGLVAGGSGQLSSGLAQMQAAVIRSRGQIPSTAALRRLAREAPGIFSSGYFVLAAVAGATPANANAASFALNVTRGGSAGQVVVVSKADASAASTEALRLRLLHLTRAFTAASGLQAAVGGPAGSLADLTRETHSRLWLDAAVVALLMAAALAIALRALLIPVLATLATMLVVAASLGVLALLFSGTNPPLGGPGSLDPMTLIGIVAVAGAVSVTFSSVLLLDLRAAVVEAGPGSPSVSRALRRSAVAGTGAGIAMLAALVPFSITDLINLRQFGIGVGVTVLLDTLLVRPLLLPAVAELSGRVGWWPGLGPADRDAASPAPPAAQGGRHRGHPTRLHVPRPHH